MAKRACHIRVLAQEEEWDNGAPELSSFQGCSTSDDGEVYTARTLLIVKAENGLLMPGV